MSDNKKPRTIACLLVALSLAVATTGNATQAREETFSRTLDLGPNGQLSLSNVAGDIEVRGGTGNLVQIEAVKRLRGGRDDDASELLRQTEIEVYHSGERARIQVLYPDRHRDHDHDSSVSVRFKVSLPRGTSVTLKSVSGDVSLEKVEGEASVSSVSGEIVVTDVQNLQTAKSVSGDVRVTDARSRRDAEISSVSGDVTIRGVEARELTISSVSGDVEIVDGSCERASMKSVSGDLRYQGRLSSGGRYEFNSHSGEVTLLIPEDVGFELEASTFSGDIDTEFEMQVQSVGRRRQNLRGVVGDGSAIIEAKTFSGDVRLRKN